MKVLKIIGILILVFIVVVLVAGLILPKDFAISRSAVINAPGEVVFKNFATFEGFNKWNPWNKMDTTAKVSIEGTDGAVGAKRLWKGNNKVGEGSMTVTNIDPGKSIDFDMAFEKPQKMMAKINVSMAAEGNGQKVTWTMKGNMPYPFNAFAPFMNMDKTVGKDFEEGLANLKALSEAAPAPTTSTYKIQDADWPDTKCLGIRQVVKFGDMKDFFGKNYPVIYKAIGGAGDKPGIPLAVYYSYDEKKGEADVAAAVPYEGKKEVMAKGYKAISLPAAKAHSIDYYGPYEKMKPAYDEMTNYLKANYSRENPDMVIEQYITDPMSEKDSTKWHTVIYFFVNDKTAASK